MPRREGHENAALFTISICLIFVACAGLLRAWIRKSAYGRDDAVIAAATLLSLGQFGSSYAAVEEGLGKQWSGLNALSMSGDLRKLNEVSSSNPQVLTVDADHRLGITSEYRSVLRRPLPFKMRHAGFP